MFAVCPVLQNPQNGYVNYSNQQRTVGTTAYYYCNSSFMVNSVGERQCQIDATWSGSAPTCTSEWCKVTCRSKTTSDMVDSTLK